MPTAHEVAVELRNIAYHLDNEPDAVIAQAKLSFYHPHYGGGAKELFLALVPLIPRPLKKGEGYANNQVTLTHEHPAVEVYTAVDKSLTCELVEPAKPAVYRCDPILSKIEEYSLEVA